MSLHQPDNSEEDATRWNSSANWSAPKPLQCMVRVCHRPGCVSSLSIDTVQTLLMCCRTSARMAQKLLLEVKEPS